MKIIKGICGLVLFLCLVAVVLIPFMYEVETLNTQTAIIGMAAIALTVLVAFKGYLIVEQLDNKKFDFMDFIHQEYIKRADERQLNRR